jgi:septum formation protein
MGFDFKIAKPRVPESSNNSDPGKRAVCNAKAKVLSVSKDYPNSVIIGVDTVVYLNGLFFGKPINSDNAKYMHVTLSGKKHQVFTGITILNTANGNILSGFEETHVYFKELSMDTILDYIATGIPFDKAGAYAIQEGGDVFVDRVEGSYSNVIGLLLDLLLSILEKIDGRARRLG